jgi:GNAT superfamily N-acetyltransferase
MTESNVRPHQESHITAANEPLRIARASPEEAQIACDILTEAALWLESIGKALWPLDTVALDPVLRRAHAGELHLAWLDGQAIGSMYLQWDDPHVWPDARAGESLFIHKLAVRRPFAGAGVSQALLAYAEITTRAAARPFLRLDCAPRAPLCRLYESAGFQRHSIAVFERNVTTARYQKQLA